MTPPKSLNEEGAAHWERFVSSVETFLALVDERYPEYHDEAEKACRYRGGVCRFPYFVHYAVRFLTSWAQDVPSAAKTARGIQNQNDFELWRLFWGEYNPNKQTNRKFGDAPSCPQSFQQKKLN